MPVKFSRRNALKCAGWGALALGQARLSGACGGSGGPASPATDAGGSLDGEAAFEPFEFDPTMPWWMQGPFAPVLEEREALQLEVTGEIPPALDGTYVRNGPNPTFDRGHWFLGHGMLHGVRLQGGKAHWYRNRFVRTHLLDFAPDQRSNAVLRPTETPSSVALVHHAGKLLSLGEVGLPYEISPGDLSTIGPYDFGGKLQTFMTAHPKLDPGTGDMHMFGYGIAEPFLTYHRVNAAGELVRSEPIVLPRAVMMHDFQITQSKIVFLDLPVIFDLAQAAAGAPVPFRWEPSHGARFGLMPHAGTNADITWFEVEPCFIFHTFNAYDDAMGNVVLDVCRYPRMFREDPTRHDADPQLYRYTLDPTSKAAKVEQLDDRYLEFPRIDPRRTGMDYRYGYGLWTELFDVSQPPRHMAVVKYDRARNSFAAHEFARNQVAGEPLFVPAAQDAGEDEGFVLTFVEDQREQRSSLEILDARDLSAPAVASIALPWRVPFGTHATWIAG